ncbi:hypothetical protein BGZ49_001577 [Haplosporangium sp. Z 27]|nr:hypothetical protein BGZ49_001577 [Haplosporangium sp. Z 27]
MTYELPPIGHALSGGVAAALANVVIYPLDMATTRVQSQSSKEPNSKVTSKKATLDMEISPIEFKRPGLPNSTSSSATTSDVSVNEDGSKKIVKTTITTTTRTSSSSLTSSASGSKKVRYTSVADAIRKTYASEGFLALYSGLESDTFATLMSNFVYFYIYMALRQYKEHRRKSGQLSTFQELFLGAEAGVISRLFTNPIHVVTTRQQVMGKQLQQQQEKPASTDSYKAGSQKQQQSKVSVHSIVREIYAQDGILGFWAGYAPTVILSINPSITYFLFETFKKFVIDRQQKAVAGSTSKSILAAAASLTSLQIFFISAFSKATASFLTYPLILTKTKLQAKSEEEEEVDGATSSGSAPKKSGGISGVISNVIRDQGILGLYTGCQGQVIKGFFSFGLMYMIKDRVVAWMLTLFLAIHNMRNRVASS